MASPHLATVLPWSSLSQVIKDTRVDGKQTACDAQPPSGEQTKALLQFARCLCDALNEQHAAASDNLSPNEREQYDPATWNIPATSRDGWCIGYYDSIVWGYLELNLLLAEPATFEPMLLAATRGRRRTDAMDAMCGDHHGEHPQWLATHLQQAFDGKQLKTLVPAVQQLLLAHCVQLFRCMQCLVAPRGRLDPDFLVEKIAWRFGFGQHVRA